MRNVFASDVNNSVSARTVYGQRNQGPSVGQRASASASASSSGAASSGSGAAAPVASGGLLGQPMVWWAALVGLLVGLMWFAQRFGGQSDEFKTIRLSFFNVVVIGIAATIFQSSAKLIAARYPVPGLSTIVLAS